MLTGLQSDGFGDSEIRMSDFTYTCLRSPEERDEKSAKAHKFRNLRTAGEIVIKFPTKRPKVKKKCRAPTLNTPFSNPASPHPRSQ